MATLLSNLQKIDIRRCVGMEEIVSNRDDEETTTSTHTHTATNLFPHLHSLYFDRLPNLKRIGGYELKFSQVGVGSWSLCQYPRKIEIVSCNALSSAIPSFAIGKMQNLQELGIGHCKSLIEVFESEEINNNNNVGNSTVPSLESINSVPQLSTLKKLKIISCDLLQHVFTFSTLDSLRQLEELRIKWCNAMKVIVKEENEETNNNNNNNVGSSTVPSLESINSVPQLSNLKKLEIISCDLLQHVFTFSTLESLRQLEELRIEGCNAMKVIVKEENEEQITKVVMFPHLKSLGLVDLPNLEGFFLGKNIDFQWPSLEKFTIDSCPQMMVFTSGWSTTPKLKYLHSSLGKHSLETDLINFRMTTDQEEESEFEDGAKAKEIVKLPCLKSLKLERLDRLQGFCLGKDDFSLPLLDTLKITRCSNLTAFTEGHVDTPALNVIDTGFGRCHIKEDLNSFIRTKQEEEFQF